MTDSKHKWKIRLLLTQWPCLHLLVTNAAGAQFPVQTWQTSESWVWLILEFSGWYWLLNFEYPDKITKCSLMSVFCSHLDSISRKLTSSVFLKSWQIACHQWRATLILGSGVNNMYTESLQVVAGQQMIEMTLGEITVSTEFQVWLFARSKRRELVSHLITVMFSPCGASDEWSLFHSTSVL